MKTREIDCTVLIVQDMSDLMNIKGEIIDSIPTGIRVEAVISNMCKSDLEGLGLKFKAKLVVELPEPKVRVSMSKLRELWDNQNEFPDIEDILKELFGEDYDR